jgi:cytochrome c-type biogenesis protein CcmE
MKPKTIIAIVIAMLATSAMVVAFLTNASPYVTVAEARTLTRDGLHIVGDIDKATLSSNVREGRVYFRMKDEKGEPIDVVYQGAPISNLSSATKVVAVGKMDGNVFLANRLIVKCPSKYEGEDRALEPGFEKAKGYEKA